MDSVWTRFMGVLGNPNHERFCQAAHARIWAGEKRVPACESAYRETISECEGSPGSFADNVRKFRNLPKIKARLDELADYAAKMAGVDAGWAMLQLKQRVADFNLDDYLTPRGDGFQRFFDISTATREQLGKLSEMTIEEDIVEAGEDTMRKVRKIKIKPYNPEAIIGLMAKIAGWLAPETHQVSMRHEDMLDLLDDDEPETGANNPPVAAG